MASSTQPPSAASMSMDTLISMLEDRSFKNTLIAEINDDVDIPILNERTEKKVLNAVYKAVLRALRRVEIE